MKKTISLKDFAINLQKIFPALKAITVSPWNDGNDPARTPEGHPYLLVVTVYTEDAVPELTDGFYDGHGTTTGWVADIILSAFPECCGGDEDAVTPLDLEPYKDENGDYDWSKTLAIL